MKAIRIIKTWSENNGMKLNCAKSAVMGIRADRRTKALNYSEVLGIPVQTEYKYLGLTISDCATAAPMEKIIRQKLKHFKRRLSM